MLKTNDTILINNGNTSDKLLEDCKEKTNTKLIHGLTGIVNLQNTCYMNSAIQAFSHIYPLTRYFFKNKAEIEKILKTNAANIFKNVDDFKVESVTSQIPLELRKKLHDPNYNPATLTEKETEIIFNNTITWRLLKLLECMWSANSTVIPTSFRKVFSDARNKFFYGFEQHDAEEAYSCILQQMQEELAEKKIIKFRTNKKSIQDFMNFKNNIVDQIEKTNDTVTKQKLLDSFKKKKKEMPGESLAIEGFREMKKYYGMSYSRITEIFSGFLLSSISCPDKDCGYVSNKFDPFLHLQLPMPFKINAWASIPLEIDECMAEYCREEALDEKNLWNCEGCNKKVKGIKKLQLWTSPPVLVLQFKRFSHAKGSKDSRLVKYPLKNFDISSMVCSYQIDGSKCYKYTLQCVINHTGNMSGGHYYIYCKDEDTGKWFEFNDSNVREVPESRIVSSSAYLLFYLREDMLNQSAQNQSAQNQSAKIN